VIDDLRRGDRQRAGVDDQTVDELGDLVNGVGKDAPGHDQPEVVGVLDLVDEPGDRDLVEQVGVIDDHRAAGGRGVIGTSVERTDLTAQAHDTGHRGLADQPRLAVPGRRLEQYHARRVSPGDTAEQRRARETHEGTAEPIECRWGSSGECGTVGLVVGHRLGHPGPPLDSPPARKAWWEGRGVSSVTRPDTPNRSIDRCGPLP
jgi:hypothetical protein